MQKVIFLTPNNERFEMNYWEVEEFCKKICLKEENKASFEEFSKKYTYFTPYFDYVMEVKKYIFFNCLFNEEHCLIFNDDAYYFSSIIGSTYSDTINNFKFLIEYLDYSDLTRISDEELDIKLQKTEYTDDCVIDPNCIGMMSKSSVGSDYGSHVVTGATVLNHLLSKSRIITEDYWKYINQYEEIYYEDFGIDYLVERLGFLRVACRDCYPIIFNNEKVLSLDCKKFCDETKRLYKYVINDMDGENSEIYKEYQKTILK